MTWILVVAGVVALAIAVHFYEKKRERERRARRLAHREQQRRELHLVSFTREIREMWEVSFQSMELRLTRHEGTTSEPVLVYRLEREAEGVWRMRANAEPRSSERLPAHLERKLEAQHQRFLAESTRRDEHAPPTPRQ